MPDEERESESRVLMAGFGLSIPVFFATANAWLLWFIIPLLAAEVRRLQRRNRHGPGGGQAPG